MPGLVDNTLQVDWFKYYKIVCKRLTGQNCIIKNVVWMAGFLDLNITKFYKKID